MRTRSTSNGCASPLVPNPFTPVKACETCWLSLRKDPFGDRLVSIGISDKFILFMPRYPEPFFAQVDELQHPCTRRCYCDIVISVPSSFVGGSAGDGTKG